MVNRRYLRILWFFGIALLGLGFWEIFLPKIGLRSLARKTRAQRLRKTARAFRAKAIQMGGVIIKLGQFLSARLDVLPLEITDELAGLQDEVRSESFEDIRKVIETEFGCSIEEKFQKIDPVPIAAASIGQVHKGWLKKKAGDSENEEHIVVVKVQRPNIETIVSIDLSALRVVGNWVHHIKMVRRRVNVPSLLVEFSRTMYEEMDYIHEGKSAEKFSSFFKDRPDVCVPHVFWELTTRRVLTLEDVGGIKITDYKAIDDAGIDRSEVANRLFNTYLKQIFEDGFFHADPHPGNLFVNPLPSEDGQVRWQLTFVDFGMTGDISKEMVAGLRELLIAIGTQDARRVIKSYQMMNILLPNADLDMLEKATYKVFKRFWGKSTPDMLKMRHSEAVEFVGEFRELIYDMPFQAPENMVLMIRCIGILSGMCTGLYKEFNVWTNIAPFAQKMVSQEAGTNWQFWLNEIGEILRTLTALPKKTETLLNSIEQGKLEIRNPELTRQAVKIERAIRKTAGAVVFLAFLMSSVQLYTTDNVLFAEIGTAAALLSLAWVIFGR
jgi:predicted unusual protein kinase regulating ubiquinone biosynthesis (AarF/ABC1/UbiB family)